MTHQPHLDFTPPVHRAMVRRTDPSTRAAAGGVA